MSDALPLEAGSGDPAPVPPARRRARDVLSALTRPKVALMLALGFSSGLPFMLIGNTLSFWLADSGVKLAVIGFLSWIGLSYSVKFLWGAVVDRAPAPLVGFLGRRRGWMIVTQLLVGGGLIGMACCDPRTQLGALIGFGLLTGLGAASQDTVIDAWRIESAADTEELGLLTAAYTVGYRVALIATEAWILYLANAAGWPVAYAVFGGLMAIGVFAALLAREPAQADAAIEDKVRREGRNPLRIARDAVIGPFADFFRTHGVAVALLMLGMITTFHLCDYLRGPMGNPYYHALGIAKPIIANVRGTIGLAGAFAGIALGGVVCLRIGARRALVLGGIVQPIAVAAFAALAWHGGDFSLLRLGPVNLTAFEAIMTFDSAAMAFAGVALATYMSSLTNLGFTATQYALMASLPNLSGKFLKGFSGVIVDALHAGRTELRAYEVFYLLSAAVGLPALALCLILAARRPPERVPESGS
jgi:PAT family beta-lactamase induction signal transducer AmpG